ncbi:MAG: hypothetical protein IAE82_06825 [Opitutaceae bacterium]|nr:hypothetical protein [Opitutaceae bacterium]
MKDPKAVTAVLGGLVVMSVIVNIVTYRALVAHEHMGAQLGEENRHLASRVRLLEATERSTRPESAAQSSAAAAPDAPSTHAEQMRMIAWWEANRAKRVARIESRVATAPAMQEAYFEQMKAALPLHYAGLFQELALSPQQVARFEAVLSKRFWAISDLVATAEAQGLARGDPGFQALYGEAVRASEDDLRALLGDAGYRRYVKHEQEVSAQSLAETVNARVAAIGAPLTAASAAALKEVLMEHSGAKVGASGDWLLAIAYGGGPRTVAAEDVDWVGAKDALKDVLADSQMEVIERIARQAAARKHAREVNVALKAEAARMETP